MLKSEISTANSKQKFTVITYKGKVLMICKDEMSVTRGNTVWSFLNKQNVNDLLIKKVETRNLAPDFDMIILKDEHVNSLLRKEGCRLEFYNLSELSKLNLTEDTKFTLTNYGEKIKTLL